MERAPWIPEGNGQEQSPYWKLITIYQNYLNNQYLTVKPTEFIIENDLFMFSPQVTIDQKMQIR